MTTVERVVDRLGIEWQPGSSVEAIPFTEGFQTIAPHHPEVVAHPRSRDEVEKLVKSLDQLQVNFDISATGHGRNSYLTDGVLIVTDRLNAVSYDPHSRIATVGGGARWRDLIEKIPNHGVVFPHGSAPSVGIAGYLLSGGVSIFARALGLGINSVIELELVTRNGEVIRLNQEAIRSRFKDVWRSPIRDGVVTQVVIQGAKNNRLSAGSFFVHGDANRDLLAAFTDWAAELADSVTASLGVLSYPDSPVFPETVRGQTVGHVRYTLIDQDQGSAMALLRPFSNSFETIAPAAGDLTPTQAAALYHDPDFAHSYVGDSLISLSPRLHLDGLWPAISNQEQMRSILDVRRLGGELVPHEQRVGLPGEWIVRLLTGGGSRPFDALAHVQKRLSDVVSEPVGSAAAFRYGFGAYTNASS